MKKLSIQNQTTEFLLYTTPNGDVKVETLLHEESLWLTQQRMAELFGVGIPAISKHLKNIFESGELQRNSVISILETTADDGKTYKVKYYNLDAAISVGYRVNSAQATQFRIWATQILKEFMIKGFAMDDERLKNGRHFGKDYFRELLERVRSIRTSERRIYQQITDIYAECCIDYNKHADTTKLFYAKVQNKFHFAITGQTAAEIIYHRVDAGQPKSGMLTYKYAPDGRVIKSDVTSAKNFLSEEESKKLERTITSYFDYIENQIEQRQALTMEEFARSVDLFLSFNNFKILTSAGSISHEAAKLKAHEEYNKFNKTQTITSDFDELTKQLLSNDE